MAAVHQVFRSSLSSAPEFVASAAGDDERRALIASYYANLMAFLKVHHEGEEALVFALLIERALEHRSILDTAASQHHDVADRITAVDDAVSAWAAQGDAHAPKLVRGLGALDEALSPHLDREEEIVPLAGAHLTVEEWGMLPGHAMANFGADKIWLIIGLIRESFTSHQRDAMLEKMSPPRQMWGTMGEASFDTMIATVRQTA
jgi:hypothetical protein